MKRILSVIVGLISFVVVYSQQPDTNQVSDTVDTAVEHQTLSNLDSLMNLWYVRQTVSDTVSSQNLNHYVDVPDSVIIRRLHYINTLIPLTYNKRVRWWIHFYLRQNKIIPAFLGLSKVYFPIFEQILDKYNLPLELEYLPIIESAFNVRARSRAGAVGLWQIMYFTGKLYGLEINSLVDQRMDPYAATDAAARILRDLYKKYGDWYLALAAYNAGPRSVNKAIVRSGGKTDFWKIYPYLPRETRQYIPGFIAIIYVMHYAKEHNYYPLPIHFDLVNTDTVMVRDTLHLKQVSEVLHIPLDQLRDLNPEYKWDIIPGQIKPYPLRLPADKVLDFIRLQDSIYHYKDSVFFRSNIVVSPSYYTARWGYYYPCRAPRRGRVKLYYTVKPGDTYGYIADWFDVTIRDLKCWNHRYSNRLRAGERIVVYVPRYKYSYYKRINYLTFAQKQKIYGSPDPVSAPQKPKDPNYVYYQIKPGESLYTISKKFPGISVEDLMRINHFTWYQVRHLKPGQWIKIRKR